VRQGKSRITVLAEQVQAQILAVEDPSVPTLRKVRRAVTQHLKPLEPVDVLDLALLLLSRPGVPKWFVYEVVHYHRKAMANLTEIHLRRLGHGLGAWGEVDAFACYLVGPAWREGRISDRVVHRWARSSDRWWRRVAVVSTVALNNTARGSSGDAARTLAVCEIVKKDSDDMVVKALSWALRELARKKAEEVRSFVKTNEACLAARILREVSNKLRTGLKNP